VTTEDKSKVPLGCFAFCIVACSSASSGASLLPYPQAVMPIWTPSMRSLDWLPQQKAL